MTTETFGAMLDDLKQHVVAHDSFEGSLQYEVTDERGVFEVSAFYRVGNQQGQGGCVLVRPTKDDEAMERREYARLKAKYEVNTDA